MNIQWTLHAREEYLQISRYIQIKFGKASLNRFVNGVLETEDMLVSNPNIGKVEPLFQGRSKMYRSLIVRGLSKVVYCIEADTLYIVAMWDTRKDPNTQASKVE